MYQTEQSQQQIVCPECGQSFTPSGYDVRPVEARPTWRNHGRVCPHCGAFTHAYIEDDRMRRYRATLEQRRVDFERRKTPGNQRAFKKAFDDYGRVYFEAQAAWREMEVA